MRQLKKDLFQAHQALNTRKQQLTENYAQFKKGIAAWALSPGTLCTALLTGFAVTYRGYGRKQIMAMTRKHLLSFPFLAAMPVLGALCHFIPLIKSFLPGTRGK